MRLLYFILFFHFVLTGCGQEPQWRYLPQVDTLAVPMGSTAVSVLRYQYGSGINFPFFVHLHHNETAADSALHFFLGQNGGSGLLVQNGRQRLVSFSISQKDYLFDPNRAFTQSGIRQTLKLLSSHNAAAAMLIKQFSDTVLQHLPASGPIIALHNNTDNVYSLLSYAKEGALSLEAGALFRNPEMDIDDFVLTTDLSLFQKMKLAGINAVLQNNEKAADDGSLGYHLGKQGRMYINIEAQHGHFREQLRMMEVVISALQP